MKKLCVVLSLFLLLAGCAAQEPAPTSTPTPTPSPEPTLTGNIFLDAEEHRHSTGFEAKPVRYTVEVAKADALAASDEEYSEFLIQRVEPVKSLGLAESYTLMFEDGTGVIYYGSDPYNANYGLVDETGSIVEPYGVILVDDNGVFSYSSFDDDQGGGSEADATVQSLLENIYNIDDMKTTVSVADGKAKVWLSANLTISTEADKEALVTSFRGLYDTAVETVSTSLGVQGIDDSYVLSTSLCSSDDIPLYCIEDGEVTLDLLTVG